MVSNANETYRQIDHLASYGLMTTYDIARNLGITEAQVSNYLAMKKGGLINRDAERAEKDLKEAQAIQEERRARRRAIVDRTARLDKIQWYIARTAGRPEVYLTLRGALIKYSSAAANSVNTKSRQLIAHHEERGRKVLEWSQQTWAGHALDLFQDEPMHIIAAIVKRAHQLCQVRRKYSRTPAE